MRKIGILGGTFDPVHLGHLMLAQEAEEFFKLDKIIFMPSAQSPLKGRAPTAPAAQRLEMTNIAIAGRRNWETSDWEIEQGGTSYSFQTALHLREKHPDADLFWIIGADQLAQLGAWYRIEDLCRLMRFVVALRCGNELVRPQKLPPCVVVEALQTRRMDISSTEIRERLGAGLPTDLFLPAEVLNFIERNSLYR